MENRFIPCNKCDICNSCGGLRGTGPQPADLMLISDFPHDNDLAYGNYFTGAVGTEWDKIAKLTDIDKSKVYITSVVKCRPPVVLKKEGSIKQNHINNCALYIEEELCLTEPKIVVLLGQHAFRRFFPKDNFTDCRGTFIWSDKYNCYFVPTYNFTAMLGSAKFDPIIKKDFDAVSNYLKTGTVPKFNPPDYRFILKEDQFPLLEAFVRRMAQVPSFSFDIETSSTNYMQAKMLSIAFSWKKDTGWTIPLWVKDEAAVKAKIDSLNKKMAELEVAQFIEIGTVTPEKVEELVKQRELENVKNNVEMSTSEIRKNVKKECLDKIKAKYKEQIRAVKQELRAYEAEVDHNPPLKQYWGDKHDYVFSKIKEILENNTPKGGHNAWFDIQMLHFMGIVVNNYEFDTLIEHHLTDEERQHGLDALSWLFTDRGGYKSKKDVYLNSESTCWANIPLDVLLPYNAMDADVTQQIHEVLVKKLDEENITWLYKNVVMPAQRALLDATYYGALVDVEFVKKQQKYFAEQIKECVLAIQNEISVAKPGYLVVESKEEQDRITQEYKDNGLPMPMFYNLASTRQMISLFKDLGFKFYKQTRTGDSLDEEVLKKFSKVKGKGKIAEILLKYREYSKLKSTYLDATLENLDKNNRIHTTYKLGHAVTGRTSCLHGDTPIYVVDPRRQVPIKDIKKGDFVLCFDDNLKPAVREVLWSGKTKHSKVVKVNYSTTGRGTIKSIICTADHPFRMRDGSYKQAWELTYGDRVLAIERDINHNGYARVYATGLEKDILEHRLVANYFGQAKHVHHKDYNKLNNVPTNLEILSSKDHVSKHPWTEEQKQKMVQSISKLRSEGKIKINYRRGIANKSYKCLDKDWMISVLWANQGKPTVFRDKYHIDYEKAIKELKRHNIDWKAIQKHFNGRGEFISSELIERARKTNSYCKAASILGVNYYRAQEILKKDNNHMIISVEPLDKSVDVYDITVKDYHNFIANGVCVHNSENPNLQNIPRDGSVKGMFIPSPGKVMVNIDMSQHELRVLSGLSNDKVMQGIYNEGRDLHLETAASIFGIPPEQVTKEQRVQAKRVNFGIPYGVSGAGLVDLLASDGIRITKTQGEKYIEGWKKKFPHAAYYLEHSKKMFSQQGYLVTPWGRRRRKYKQYYANSGKESASDRQAMNYPIQSFASDIVLSLIGKLYPILKSMGIPLLLTVHDSIVVECREDQLAELARLVKQYTWLRPKELNGALVCTEMEIGYRWSEVVPMNFDEPEYARWRIVKAGKIVYYWGSEASAKKYAEGKFKEGYELYRETGA